MRIIYKRLFLLCLAAGGVPAARAQLILNRQVNASSGGSGTAGTYNFEYTIGEMTAVSTLTKGAIMLTQGFHQPEDFSVLPPGEIPVLNMIVYPNPAATTVKIQFDMLSNNAVTLFIINTSGQLVYQQTNPYAAGRVLITLAVNHFAPGIYTVMLRAGGHAFQEKLVIQ